MSIIARKPLLLPQGVKVELNTDIRSVCVSGKYGQLDFAYPSALCLEMKSDLIQVTMLDGFKNASAFAGTTWSLINNMIIGVSKGFEKKLILEGVGYRAELKNDVLVLHLGYSHPVEIFIPTSLKVTLPTSNEVAVWGIDKQKVGQFSADIRAYRKPEPYKGKGIRYSDEVIKRKEAKKK